MTQHFTVHTLPPTHSPVALVTDAAAISLAGATFLGYLPSIAAVLSIIWLSMQIIATVDRWIHRKEYRRKFKIVPDEDDEES